MFNSYSNRNLVLDKSSLLASQRDESLQQLTKKLRKRKRGRGSIDVQYVDPSPFQSRKLEASESAISLLSNIQQYQSASVPPPQWSAERSTQDASTTLNANASKNKLLLSQTKRSEQCRTKNHKQLELMSAASTAQDRPIPLIKEPGLGSEKIPRKLLQKELAAENQYLDQKISRKRRDLSLKEAGAQPAAFKEIISRRSHFSVLAGPHE